MSKEQIARIEKLLGLTIVVVSILLSIFIISYAYVPFMLGEQYGIVFLMAVMVLCVLQFIRDMTMLRGRPRGNLLAGAILVVLSVAVGLYMFVQYPHLTYERLGVNTVTDYIVAITVVYLVLQICWLTGEKAIPIVVGAFILYGFIGSWLPGLFYHRSFSVTGMLQSLVLGIAGGVYGTFIQMAGTWIAIFMLYAGIVQGFGGLDYILRVVTRITRPFKYGVPQVAVVASMFFGTFSGSAAANAAADGVFTISLMKRRGLPPPFAGAVEAVASTGGQIMPPVMGAAAFIMCDFLGKSYAEIMMRGFAPAFIFYIVVAVSVYLISRRLMGPAAVVQDSTEERLSFRYLLQGLPILLSLGILLELLAVLQFGVSLSGFVLIASYLVTRLIYDLAFSRGRVTTLKQYLINLVEGLKIGALSLAPMAVMIACLGLIVGVLVNSGLAQTISWIMVDIAGGQVPILLLMILIVCTLFGMAVTTAIAYVLTVMLAAPALLQLGVPLIVTHFTVFYIATLSAITPPVAVATAITSRIAGASFMKTSWAAIRLGLPLFILPFVFVTHPELLSGNLHAILPAILTLIGLLAVAVGIFVPMKGTLGMLSRLALGIAGLGILFATPVSILAIGSWFAIFLFAGASFFKYRRSKSIKLATTT